jgi:hypothetical protein
MPKGGGYSVKLSLWHDCFAWAIAKERDIGLHDDRKFARAT